MGAPAAATGAWRVTSLIFVTIVPPASFPSVEALVAHRK
jgi:hypothetical protein